MQADFTAVVAEQRSAAWHAARSGLLTASAAKHVLSSRRSGGESVGRKNLRTQLAVERITGQPAEDAFQNDHMRRGVELEADAIAAYEAVTGLMVRRVGFLRSTRLAIGCSPDGMLDDVNGVEIKIPALATHASYVLEGVLPSDYKPQIYHSLLVTGAEHWDFCSYDPRFPEPLRTFVVRTHRKDVDMAAYKLAVTLFLGEVDRAEAELRKLVAAREVA